MGKIGNLLQFSPNQQLSTKQLLTPSPQPPQWDGEKNQKRAISVGWGKASLITEIHFSFKKIVIIGKTHDTIAHHLLVIDPCQPGLCSLYTEHDIL